MAEAQRAGLEEEAACAYNVAPQDMLRRMPGVTARNVRVLMNNIKSLAELAETPLGRLTELIGDTQARQLFEFLNAQAPSVVL